MEGLDGKAQAYRRLLREYLARGVGNKGILSRRRVHEGRVYFGAHNGVIYSLDAATETEIWSQPYGEWVGASSIVIPRQGLIRLGIEHAGSWARGGIEMSGQVYRSPRLVDGRVIVSATSGIRRAIDPDTLEALGLLQWPFERRPVSTVAGGGNFKLIAANVDIQALRQEVLSQPQSWLVSTVRQDSIRSQRETESIFLRALKSVKGISVPRRDMQESEPTELGQQYPATMRWLESFAHERNAALSRVLLAKLKPHSQVYRHRDSGEYYRFRDRFHLVLDSPAGSPMVCGDEEVVMREGELWWFDNKKPHEAFNRTDRGRIHLIFDLLPNAT